MATPPIQHRRNGTAGVAPALADLVYGELAINYADGKLFTKVNNAGTDVVVELTAQAAGTDPAWADITGKPPTFPPSAHTHAISEVTGLQTALDDSMTLSTGQTVSGAKTFEGGFTVESEKVNLGSGTVGISRTISAEHVRSNNLQFNLTGGDLELAAGAVNSSRVGNNEARTYKGGDVHILAGNAEYAGTWGNTVTKGATVFGQRSINPDTGAFTDVEFGRFRGDGVLSVANQIMLGGSNTTREIAAHFNQMNAGEMYMRIAGRWGDGLGGAEIALVRHGDWARDSEIVFKTTAGSGGALTERMRISETGVLSLPGVVRPVGGINFNASGGNTLSDYEEGTFTPSLGASAGAFSQVNYTDRVGYYTRVGNLVTVWGRINTSTTTHGTASGTVRITGLPFTSKNVTGTLVVVGSLTRPGGSGPACGSCALLTNVTYLSLSNTSNTPMLVSTLTTGRNDFTWTITYAV